MSDAVIRATERWVTDVVIGLNLCPFAKREWLQNKVRLTVTDADSPESLLEDLVVEMALLNRRPGIETSLLIHPNLLTGFDDYNQFLDFVDATIEQMSLSGVYQIASFHPEYRFAGSAAEDVENYTNRSPYPMLHILRESSMVSAVDLHPDTSGIPVSNIKLLRKLGVEHMRALLHSCSETGKGSQR